MCRGEVNPVLFDPDPWVLKAAMSLMLRVADTIIYKEPVMRPVLDRICPRTPKHFSHNAIPVGPEPRYDDRPIDVLFLNRFQPWRRPDTVVRAADIVRRAMPQVRFVLAGRDSGMVPARNRERSVRAEYERSLDQLVDSLGLRANVSILDFTDEASRFTEAAKLFVLPADAVFCNYSLLEAMERGVPAIVSDHKDPYARLIVEHGRNGMVADPDPESIASTILSLLQDEKLRLRLAVEARKTVCERFNLATALGDLAQLYRSLAD